MSCGSVVRVRAFALVHTCTGTFPCGSSEGETSISSVVLGAFLQIVSLKEHVVTCFDCLMVVKSESVE